MNSTSKRIDGEYFESGLDNTPNFKKVLEHIDALEYISRIVNKGTKIPHTSVEPLTLT